MAGRGRRSRKRTSDRRRDAEEAIRHLSSSLNNRHGGTTQVAENAARQILAIGKKHGVRPGSEIKRKICRSCKISLTPGINSRFRVSSKKLIITCLECGRVERHGPNFGGLVNE